jgi:hypothetical protein
VACILNVNLAWSDEVSKTTRYQVSENGTSFRLGTCAEVRAILDAAINSRRNYRLRVWLGDTATGRAWAGQEHDHIGYIGRSTGSINVPLMVYNSRSLGGGAILDDFIVRITCGRTVLYSHPNFSQPRYTAEACAVLEDGEIYAPECKSPEAARRLAAFMNGERNSK